MSPPARKLQERRSLKYIRLAAHLAGQQMGVTHVVMSFPEIEAIVGETLPENARFPSWWRNDVHKMHSRAWLTAGWEAEGLAPDGESVVFTRRPEA